MHIVLIYEKNKSHRLKYVTFYHIYEIIINNYLFECRFFIVYNTGFLKET